MPIRVQRTHCRSSLRAPCLDRAATCSRAGAAEWRRARSAGRLAARGRAGSAASDFGALEVFAGASIAHTDPFAVCRALDEGEPRVLAGAFLDCCWSLSGDMTSAASPAMHAELGHGDLVLLPPLHGPAAAGVQALWRFKMHRVTPHSDTSVSSHRQALLQKQHRSSEHSKGRVLAIR